MSDNNFWASYQIGRRRAQSESRHPENENGRLKRDLAMPQDKTEGPGPSKEQPAPSGSKTAPPISPALERKHRGAHREIQDASSPSAEASSPTPDFHPLVVETKKQCDPKRLGMYGFMYVGYKRGRCIRMRVGPSSVDRALRLFDALFKLAESRGHRVEVPPGESEGANIVVGGQPISISLLERVDRRKHIASIAELKRNREFPSWPKLPEVDHFPSGRFQIEIGDYWSPTPKRKWDEGGRWRHETRLDSILAGVEKAAHFKKKHWDEEERQARAREEQRRKVAAAAAARQEEKRRCENLELHVNRWLMARNIRAFVLEARTTDSDAYSPPLAAEDWCIWALRYADSIDPLKGSDPLPESQNKCEDPSST